MSAGMVSVPAIVPLKMPGLGAAGSRKWCIDSKTLIEMHSSTKGCLIFYTLDGTKPDPFKKIGDKTTYRYVSTITLSPGKRTLKAMAILKDGSKESNVNTKVFQVSEAMAEEVEEKTPMNTTWKNQTSDSEEEVIDSKMFKKVMRLSEERLPPQKKDPIKKILIDESFKNGSLNNQQSFLKEQEYLLCPYCDEPRPADPYARFCNGCNSILPPAPGRIRSSQYNSNSSFQNSLRNTIGNMRQKLECKNCGTSNPNDAVQCLVCDTGLISGINISKLKKDKAPEPSKNFIICPYCTRVNSGDARFCDWCGEKSNTKSRMISCQRCTAENLVTSQYCCSCGKNLPAPPRESLEKVLEDGNLQIKETKMKSEGKLDLLQTLTNEGDNWKSIEFESITRKESKNVSLQVGDSMITPMEKLSLKGPMKISPGKGFWRQQVDYVAQHFKVFTQNNVTFREQFSNQSLSTLISASLHETDTDKNEKELVLLFSTPEDGTKMKKKKTSKKNINSGETLINALKTTSRPSSGRSRPSSAKSFTLSSTADLIDSARSSVSGSRPSSARRQKVSQKTLEKEKREAYYAKLSEDTNKLLNMIKSSKTPDIDEFESLIDSDDVNINVNDENGILLLTLAILNKHFDVILPLIIGGANIDAVSGPKQTTALHEAVLLGISGKDAVEILLDNDASFTIRDKRGKSAHDLALQNGSDIILSVFNQHTSKGLLNDVMKL